MGGESSRDHEKGIAPRACRGTRVAESHAICDPRVVAEAERRKIQRAVREAGGDKGRAADLLQVGYKTLLAKMRELGVDS